VVLPTKKAEASTFNIFDDLELPVELPRLSTRKSEKSEFLLSRVDKELELVELDSAAKPTFNAPSIVASILVGAEVLLFELSDLEQANMWTVEIIRTNNFFIKVQS
jgi:hypothetical protein